MQGLTYRDLLQLVTLIESSSRFREFRFRSGDIELELKRGGGGGGPPEPDRAAAVDATAGRDAPAPAGARHASGTQSTPDTPDTPGPNRSNIVPTPIFIPDGAIVIRSPMVGTFYRAPEPGAKPFVEVGSRVGADSTVCIIEVMKLMNSIPARCEGVVSRILVDDGAPLEQGQPLLVIEPA
jgi:acetyl-CoA carboxylase biotin carboxyl carrier protein